ncbi:hypothetical protein QJQ45_011078 [Haematococcus lacustris]|nr:hypothetical protein QJQ45_011078 [Haematococcus lacustris]
MTASILAATVLEGHLAGCVQESLSLFLFDNAKWLAERLVAQSPSEQNVSLLAVCYFQANQAYRAYQLLRSSGITTHSARYLLALCCIQLGKLNDARDALLKQGDREVPLGAAGLYLLGRVYRLVGRLQDAKEQYVQALRLNPLMWSAYEELCALGCDEEAQEVCNTAANCHALVLSGALEQTGHTTVDGSVLHPDVHVRSDQGLHAHQQLASHKLNSARVARASAPSGHKLALRANGQQSTQSYASPAMAQYGTPAAVPGLFATSNAPPETAFQMSKPARHADGRQQPSMAPRLPQGGAQPQVQGQQVYQLPAAGMPSQYSSTPDLEHQQLQRQKGVPSWMLSAKAAPSREGRVAHGAGDRLKPGPDASHLSAQRAAWATPDPLANGHTSYMTPAGPTAAGPAAGHDAATQGQRGGGTSEPQAGEQPGSQTQLLHQQQQQATAPVHQPGAWGSEGGGGPLQPDTAPALMSALFTSPAPSSLCSGPPPLMRGPNNHPHPPPTHSLHSQAFAMLRGGHSCSSIPEWEATPAGPAAPLPPHAQPPAAVTTCTPWARPPGPGWPPGPTGTECHRPCTGSGSEALQGQSTMTPAAGQPLPGSLHAAFVTPAPGSLMDGPPGPPQKGAGLPGQDRAGLHPPSAIMAGRSEAVAREAQGQQGGVQVHGAALAGSAPPPEQDSAHSSDREQPSVMVSPRSHHQSPRQAAHQGGAQGRTLMDEGKVRKISGKSLFSDTSRRSSRLAALAAGGSGGNTGPCSPGQPTNLKQGSSSPLGAAPNGSAASPAAGGHPQGVAHLQQWTRQSQNQPNTANPPPAPVRLQALFDGKLGGMSRPHVGYSLASSLGKPGLGHNAAPLSNGQLLAPGAADGLHSSSTVQGSSGKCAEGQARALAVLRYAYEGYRALAMHRCEDAVQSLQALPPAQYRTAWVACQVGRAYSERMDYHKAAAAFETARQLDRYRVEGMEVFSTVLWHMKRSTDLSYLAQDMLALDRLAPQTWCVLGNFLSLQQEHEAALKLFERALQLDPSFTYAYTLSGHEYSASEDFDKALACYRNALRFDSRHYNAMYGIGQIHFRQEKYDVALCHFRSAAAVNPRSSVLTCYIGMALAKQGIYDKALAKLQEAIVQDPRNPLARYEKSAVLAAIDDLPGSLSELQALSQIAPGESSVYFQMGKLFKRLGDLRAAQQQFELALSIQASSADAAMIKTAIEKLSGVGESMQRPVELCSYEGLEALPIVGTEYQQGYKRVNDRLPKGRQRLHRAAEYRRGIDGRARINA